MRKRLKVLFTGMVQGVGFRFSTERIARQHEVTGYVRNLPNGKVEVVAEGDEDSLEEFLKAVCEGPMSRYIEDADCQWSDFCGGFERFSIFT